jgi:hypothetical protein
MSAACRMTRRAPVRAAMMASILGGATARADDVPAYCGELRQVAAAGTDQRQVSRHHRKTARR